MNSRRLRKRFSEVISDDGISNAPLISIEDSSNDLTILPEALDGTTRDFSRGAHPRLVESSRGMQKQESLFFVVGFLGVFLFSVAFLVRLLVTFLVCGLLVTLLLGLFRF